MGHVGGTQGESCCRIRRLPRLFRGGGVVASLYSAGLSESPRSPNPFTPRTAKALEIYPQGLRFPLMTCVMSQ